jgi:CheY-like chemotaxis protein
MVGKALLLKEGVKVEVVKDGLESLEYFAKNHADLILMDINMPRMDGIEATKELHQIMKQQNRKTVPIIALTANVMQGAKEEYLDKGMDDYLTKPIDPNALRKILKHWLLN